MIANTRFMSRYCSLFFANCLWQIFIHNSVAHLYPQFEFLDMIYVQYYILLVFVIVPQVYHWILLKHNFFHKWGLLILVNSLFTSFNLAWRSCDRISGTNVFFSSIDFSTFYSLFNSLIFIFCFQMFPIRYKHF